jgi:carboxypeptidase C (cathepsin A)
LIPGSKICTIHLDPQKKSQTQRDQQRTSFKQEKDNCTEKQKKRGRKKGSINCNQQARQILQKTQIDMHHQNGLNEKFQFPSITNLAPFRW